MTAFGFTVREDCNRPGAVIIYLPAGNPFWVQVRVDGSKSAAHAALRDALVGRSWNCEVRRRRGATGAPKARFEPSESVDGEVLTLTFTCSDVSDLEADTTYYFDFRVLDGPTPGAALLAGSSVVVESTVSTLEVSA